MTKFKCPACNGGNFTLYERVEVSDAYAVVDGLPVSRSAGDNPTQVGFYAECVCGNGWVPKSSTGTAIIDAEFERRSASREATR